MSDEQFDSIDFFGTKDLIEDPYPYFEHLRGQCPVTKEPFHDVYMVTGYDEAVEVYHDQATFSNCNSAIGPFAKFPVPLEGDDVTEIIETYRYDLPFGDQIPTFDPPKHTEQRGLLMRLITPKRLKENEESLRRLADNQIDRFHARGECEFVGEYAGPYTLLVIADLLGVPEEDHAEFLEKLTHHSHVEMTHSPLEYLYAQFTGYIEDRRRRTPGRRDDRTGHGHLPRRHPASGRGRDEDRLQPVRRRPGDDSPASGHRPADPGRAPRTAAALRDDGSLIPAFIEETLRLEPPIKGTFRLSRTPTTVRDTKIPAGSTVMVLPAAANRDPREFEEPDDLRLDRANARQHIAFGHGIHTCAGAPLARAESNMSLHRLLDRMEDIRIAESHHGPAGARHWEYTPTWMLRGHDRLYLEFTPSAEQPWSDCRAPSV